MAQLSDSQLAIIKDHPIGGALDPYRDALGPSVPGRFKQPPAVQSESDFKCDRRPLNNIDRLLELLRCLQQHPAASKLAIYDETLGVALDRLVKRLDVGRKAFAPPDDPYGFLPLCDPFDDLYGFPPRRDKTILQHLHTRVQDRVQDLFGSQDDASTWVIVYDLIRQTLPWRTDLDQNTIKQLEIIIQNRHSSEEVERPLYCNGKCPLHSFVHHGTHPEVPDDVVEKFKKSESSRILECFISPCVTSSWAERDSTVDVFEKLAQNAFPNATRESATFDLLRFFLENFEAQFKQAPQCLQRVLGMETKFDWDDARFQGLVSILIRRYSGENLSPIPPDVCIKMVVCLFINVPSYWRVYDEYPLRPPRFLECDPTTPRWYPNSECDRELRVNFEAFYSDPTPIVHIIKHPGPAFAKALTRAIRASFMQRERIRKEFMHLRSGEFEDIDLEPIDRKDPKRVKALEEMHAILASRSLTFNPTQKDVREVLADLQLIRLGSGRILPPELALSIVSMGYGPRLVKQRRLEQRYRANNFWRPGPRASVAGLYLSTEPLPRADSSLGFIRVIPQRIVFQTTAEDQGWADSGGEGTFGRWNSFFEASVLRPVDVAANRSVALEEVLSGTWETPLDASDALKERGWGFVRSGDGQTFWKVCNNVRAGKDYRNYRVEWGGEREASVDDNRVGMGQGFLELLAPGYVVVLWARATEQSWENRVKAATIEIEYELR